MSHHQTDCILCKVVAGDQAVPFGFVMGKDRSIDQFILKTNTAHVIADVAPIVAGHFLIVTTTHITSLAQCTANQLSAIDNLKNRIGSQIEKNFGVSPIWFEHGECKSTSHDSCQVFHTHIHGLPVSAKVFNNIESKYDFNKLSGIKELTQVGSDKSYLYIECQAKGGRVAIMDPPSQFLRKIICEELNLNDRWNWHEQVSKESNRRLIEDGLNKLRNIELSV
ncbi:MAG: HIT domain-containing protein [Candidatus Thiodiazotropha taylori]